MFLDIVKKGNDANIVNKSGGVLINGKSLLDTIYPIGSIYLSINDTSPMDLFGGIWEQIKDKFLLACGDSYELLSEGGEAEHKLEESEMPSHAHSMTFITDYSGSEWGPFITGQKSSSWTIKTMDNSDGNNKMKTTGGSQPHNNMPPYIAVKVWKRTTDVVE